MVSQIICEENGCDTGASGLKIRASPITHMRHNQTYINTHRQTQIRLKLGNDNTKPQRPNHFICGQVSQEMPSGYAPKCDPEH